jgi:pimeloyl-ACP methyl ester carboxylesterase
VIASRRAALAATAAALLPGCTPDLPTHSGAGGVEIAFARGRSPAVVFENGLGGALGWWDKVIAALPPGQAWFAYNRPGIGRTPATAAPRDGATIVAALRASLAAEGFAPPYVLVGHSLGGLYAQLYARAHPNEVAALVLVDTTHPRQFDGDGAIDRQTWWVRTALGVLVRGNAADELATAPETGRQVLALPPPAGVPVFVLSAQRPMRDNSGPAERHANAMRADVATLYPGARQIWVDSGHAVPMEAPDAIAAAIREALGAAR